VRRALLLIVAAAVVAGCGEPPPSGRPIAVRAVDPAPVETALSRPTVVIDTVGTALLELWPLAVDRSRQADETRRLVEHLQADLSLVPGFGWAAVLASGDGSSLLLSVAWRDSAAAGRGDTMLAGWLRLPSDTALRRRQDGTLTPRVLLRRSTGATPQFREGAMLLFTRYVMKPGHSFGALATLADSNLAMRVLQDTAAQGGALLAASDSGALYMVLQARNATALDPGLGLPTTSLPFWAPFAMREEQLMAVVAIITPR
jgi:hypothetical protein